MKLKKHYFLLLFFVFFQYCTYDSIVFDNDTGSTQVITFLENTDTVSFTGDIVINGMKLPDNTLCLNDSMRFENNKRTCYLLENNASMEVKLKSNYNTSYPFVAYGLPICSNNETLTGKRLSYNGITTKENNNQSFEVMSYVKNGISQSKKPVLKDKNVYLEFVIKNINGCNVDRDLYYILDSNCAGVNSTVKLSLANCANKNCGKVVNITGDNAVYIGKLDVKTMHCPGNINSINVQGDGCKSKVNLNSFQVYPCIKADHK